jgi:hypothetical protein
MKYVAFAALVWGLAVCAHLLWESWIIVRSDFQEIPVCRHWWCPHGLMNRFREK